MRADRQQTSKPGIFFLCFSPARPVKEPKTDQVQGQSTGEGADPEESTSWPIGL